MGEISPGHPCAQMHTLNRAPSRMAKQWTLMTVSYGGTVSTNRFDSKALAEEARSIALTGLTLAENKEADRQYREREERLDAACRSANPPRPPTERERKSYSHRYCGSDGHIGEDGLFYPARNRSSMSPAYGPGTHMEMVRGWWVAKTSGDIKRATILPPSASKARPKPPSAD